MGGEQFSLTKIVKVDAASPELKLIPAERLQPIAQRRFQRSQQQRFHHDDQSILINKKETHFTQELHERLTKKQNYKTTKHSADFYLKTKVKTQRKTIENARLQEENKERKKKEKQLIKQSINQQIKSDCEVNELLIRMNAEANRACKTRPCKQDILDKKELRKLASGGCPNFELRI